jgi:hypothetical protein
MSQMMLKTGDLVFYKGMPYQLASFMLIDEVSGNIVKMGIPSMNVAVEEYRLFPDGFAIQVKIIQKLFGDTLVLPLKDFIAYNWSHPGLMSGNQFENGRILKFVLETEAGTFTEYELASISNLEEHLQEYKPVLKVLLEIGKRLELVPYRRKDEQPQKVVSETKRSWLDTDLAPDGMFS